MFCSAFAEFVGPACWRGLFVFVQFVFVLIPPFWPIEGSGQDGRELFGDGGNEASELCREALSRSFEHTIEKQGVERR